MNVAWRAAAGFFEFAEMQREAELLLVGQGLVAKHQNGVFRHAGMDRRDLVGRQPLAAVDARYFACEGRGKLSDR
jgi:hypothetical protein